MGYLAFVPSVTASCAACPIVMKADGKIVPALALDMLRVATDSGAILIRADEAGIRSVAVAGLELPTDGMAASGCISTRMIRRAMSPRTTCLDGRAAPDRFDGRLALIGASAIGLSTSRPRQSNAAIPGVEVHAQLLASA